MSKQSSHKGPLGDKFEDYEFEPGNSAWNSIEDALHKEESSAPLEGKFDDHLEPVSVDVWEEIEKELHPEKKRRFIIWWSGVAAGLISVLMILNLNSNDELQSERLVKTRTHGERGSDFNVTQEGQIAEGNTILNVVKALPKEALTMIRYAQDINTNESSSFDKSEINNSDYTLAQEVGKVYEQLSLDNKLVQRITNEEKRIYPEVNVSDLLKQPEKANDKIKSRNNALRFGVSPMLGFEKNEPLSEGFQLNSTASISNDSYSTVSIDNSGAVNIDSSNIFSNDVILSSMFTPSAIPFLPNSTVKVSHEKTYNQPISLGFLFSHGIHERLVVSSGIEFLTSGYTYKEGYWKAYDRKGVKNYIGVPLSVSYNLIHRRRIKLYPLIGLKALKGIYGKETYIYGSAQNDAVLQDEKIENKELVVTGSYGVGGQVSLYKNLNLFLQVSSEHSIKTPDDSFWEKNPTALSIQTGISLEL